MTAARCLQVGFAVIALTAMLALVEPERSSAQDLVDGTWSGTMDIRVNVTYDTRPYSSPDDMAWWGTMSGTSTLEINAYGTDDGSFESDNPNEEGALGTSRLAAQQFTEVAFERNLVGETCTRLYNTGPSNGGYMTTGQWRVFEEPGFNLGFGGWGTSEGDAFPAAESVTTAFPEESDCDAANPDWLYGPLTACTKFNMGPLRLAGVEPTLVTEERDGAPATILVMRGTATLRNGCEGAPREQGSVEVDYDLVFLPGVLPQSVHFDWLSSPVRGTRVVRFDPSASELSPGATIEWDFGDGTSASSTDIPFNHVYPDMGEYTVTATLRCADCEASSYTDRVVVDPITAYSPQARMDTNETRYPSSPRWFAEHSILRWNHDQKCKDHKVASTPNLLKLSGKRSVTPYKARKSRPTARFCRRSEHHGSNYSAKRVTRPYQKSGPAKASGLRGSDIAEGFYLDLRNAYRGGQGMNAPMNYNFSDADYITYWLFFPHDTKANAAVYRALGHEGDWERVSVRLDDHNRAESVMYFQHECNAEELEWDEVARFDNTHPIVYTARGSHASYPYPVNYTLLPPQPGTYACPAATEEGAGVKGADWQGAGDVTDGMGDHWSPWLRGPGGLVDATTEPWYGFGGAWGEVTAPSASPPNDDLRSGSTGPLGPPHKNPGSGGF